MVRPAEGSACPLNVPPNAGVCVRRRDTEVTTVAASSMAQTAPFVCMPYHQPLLLPLLHPSSQRPWLAGWLGWLTWLHRAG